MGAEDIAGGKQERRASDATERDLVREFHARREHMLARHSPYVLGRLRQIGEILISVNSAGPGLPYPAMHQI